MLSEIILHIKVISLRHSKAFSCPITSIQTLQFHHDSCFLPPGLEDGDQDVCSNSGASESLTTFLMGFQGLMPTDQVHEAMQVYWCVLCAGEECAVAYLCIYYPLKV